MAFDVNQFRAALTGDGARPNLFQIQLVFPNYINNASLAGVKTTFMASSAQLPDSNIGTAPLYYFGRESKHAGNRTYSPWTINIINDEDFVSRDAFMRWHDAINAPVGSIRDVRAAILDGGYAVDSKVTQFGKTGNVIKTYNFVGMWPANVSPIEMNWQANDQIEEFSVTFDYQYWTEADSALGTAAAAAATAAGAAV